MGTVTGKNAKICIYSGSTAKKHSVWGISDFSLTVDRGTVEQELVGETGNCFTFGALSIDGSYTNCKFAASGNADALISIIDGCNVIVSGSIDTYNLSWFFTSCQITGYDISIGDADTITEASIDFTVMDPYRVTYNASTGHIQNNG
ncbi:MAG: hypothetical protein DRG71_08730 [Deltaproteobacteria bacterium]|nr:MAG: hypothetical protein DRG71_08730 [Deltaproteobacteria bacterium]